MPQRTVLGGILKTALSQIDKGRLPKSSGSITLSGLDAPVEVLTDTSGVPHVYATSQKDMFFAQGFLTAQERLFQMELNRRTANGRLSEIVGKAALDTDRASLTFGFARLGKADWDFISPELRDTVTAYVAGINAYITGKTYKQPVELMLMGVKPRLWTTDDVMAFTRLMVWQLSHAWYGEVVRAKLIDKVGPEHAAEWEVFTPPANLPTLPKGIEFNKLDPNGKLIKAKGPYLQQGIGSNVWAVSGARSDSGKPYLCNDMHLVLGLPGLWYEMHLSCPDYNTIGATLPGAPMVLAGHNEKISWGITLAYTDCEDLFIEQFDPEKPEQYKFKNKWEAAQVIEEVIPIKGGESHTEKVLITRHGPVISDVIGASEQRLAVQSMSLRECGAFDGFLSLGKAKGWDGFVNAVKKINAPQLSIGYADVDGNIGWWATGKLPIRANGQGMVPNPGWTGEFEWVGEVPFDMEPHTFNPQKGYVVNCNNQIATEKDYPYFLGTIWMNGYRARRLSDMIEETAKVSKETFKKMQTDVTCLPGKEFQKLVTGFDSKSDAVERAVGALLAWDGVLDVDSVGGTIYEVVRYRLVDNLMRPVLGEEFTKALLGHAFNDVIFPDHEFYGNDTQAVFKMLAEGDKSWWVQQAGGKQALLEKSFTEAVEWLQKTLGAEMSDWKWGRIHAITFGHALAMQKPLDEIFNRGPYPLGGDTDTPWQAAMAPGDPYDNKLWAPSVRHIFDTSDWSKSLFTLPAGQSGHVSSKHYDDMIPNWREGCYLPLNWTREQVESDLEGRLMLSKG